jgi:hypothetical protein
VPGLDRFRCRLPGCRRLLDRRQPQVDIEQQAAEMAALERPQPVPDVAVLVGLAGGSLE